MKLIFVLHITCNWLSHELSCVSRFLYVKTGLACEDGKLAAVEVSEVSGSSVRLTLLEQKEPEYPLWQAQMFGWTHRLP